MQTLKEFATKVQKMRLAQTRYFELSAIARKTKTPEAFKAQKDMLTIAKQLEQEVDKDTHTISIS
jgi:hypothetical protein